MATTPDGFPLSADHLDVCAQCLSSLPSSFSVRFGGPWACDIVACYCDEQCHAAHEADDFADRFLPTTAAVASEGTLAEALGRSRR